MHCISTIAAAVIGLGCLGCATTGGSGAATRGTGPAALPTTGATTPTDGALQAVLVTTPSWSAIEGTLTRWERSDAASAWTRVGEPIAVVVGHGGLGWGAGLHPDAEEGDGPRKHEGDGRAPAGVFRLGSAFGYAPPADVPGIRLPYIQSTGDWKCVDDTASAQYNRVLDERTVTRDWNSHEEMRRDDELYRLGIIVEHNWGARTRPGDGSCIFMHIWKGPGQPTVGCTAMRHADIEQLLRWLDPARNPVLVQLPVAEHDRLASEWRLP